MDRGTLALAAHSDSPWLTATLIGAQLTVTAPDGLRWVSRLASAPPDVRRQTTSQ